MSEGSIDYITKATLQELQKMIKELPGRTTRLSNGKLTMFPFAKNRRAKKRTQHQTVL